MVFKDFYHILELTATATQDEIKVSYRRLALKHHPDRNFGDKKSEAKFKEVQEAYETLSDSDSRHDYDISYKNHFKKQESTKEPQTITPLFFLKTFRELRNSISVLPRRLINREVLFKKLNDLLDKNCVAFLISYGDKKTNSDIIDQVLQCCNSLDYSRVNELCPNLITLAATDKDVIDKINSYKKRRRNQYWFFKELVTDSQDFLENRGVSISGILALGIIIGIIWGISSLVTYFENKDRPKTGELYNNAQTTNQNNDPNNSKSSIKPLKILQDAYSDWDSTDYTTGSSPACYNYKPKYNKSIDNKLKISVGSNTDVVIKLVRIETGKCIRYVFVRHGETYTIRNIPEGRYYLKIAYGKDWRQKIINDKCVGKFVSNSLYKKGSDILDFNKVYKGVTTEGDNSYNNYQIPSYTLSLDVISTPFTDDFKTNEISEKDFNDDE